MRSRPFIALYAAVFVATMGISMVSPLLPVYAKELGASGVWLGLTFSVFAIVQTFVGPFAGRLSDRYGRKPFIVAGLCIYLVAALGYLTAGSFYQVIAFRAFSGLGTSLIFSVARAYVGDMTPKGQEGRWLGVFATADIIGFGTGPLLAGVLREVVGFRSVFVAMAILMATSALILMWWLPRHSPAEVLKRASLARGEARETQTPFAVALKDRLVVAVTAHQGLISLASGASFSFLALRLEDGLGVSPMLIGLAFATQDITGGLAQPLFGRMADAYSRRVLVAAGLLVNGALLACVGIVPTYGLMVPPPVRDGRQRLDLPGRGGSDTGGRRAPGRHGYRPRSWLGFERARHRDRLGRQRDHRRRPGARCGVLPRGRDYGGGSTGLPRPHTRRPDQRAATGHPARTLRGGRRSVARNQPSRLGHAASGQRAHAGRRAAHVRLPCLIRSMWKA
ncbi:MAG: MFS transporter [Dehalococcoidia bacterium]|nr:MFS transporter [Dehalococcoidia bacterium]